MYEKSEYEGKIKEWFGDSVGETTKKQHSVKLSQWIMYTEKKTLKDLIYDKRCALESLEKADIKQSATNRHIYINAITCFIKHVIKENELEEDWKRELKENWKPIEERYDSNEPSDKQKGKIMDMKDIEVIRVGLEKGSLERLLLTMYTRIEPIRADYYATEIVYEESKTENYINLSSNEIIVRDFKTKNTYKVLKNNIKKEIREELDKSLELYPRKYLFVMEDMKSPYMSRKLFSNWACRTLSRILNHPMTLTVLRHLYVMKESEEKTGKELLEIARRMGHSRGTQRMYEWKV